MSTLTDEIACWCTFAIISHPDTGKTTFAEKLLLSGGAIQPGGEVRTRGERRRTRPAWMAIARSAASPLFDDEALSISTRLSTGSRGKSGGHQVVTRVTI